MEERTTVELPAPAREQDHLDLGKWLGRREAFGLIAGRCSAADVECMRRIRDGQLYKDRAADWAEFCENELHMSKSNANRVIALLENFGPQYFHISQISRISVANYRAIASAVRTDGIECDGEFIPFHEENTGRIAAAVSRLSAAQHARPERTLEERMQELDAAADRLLNQFRELRQECGGASRELFAIAARLARNVGQLHSELR